MFEIEFTPEAMDDLKALRKYEQIKILDALETRLCHQPTEATKNLKRLRPNEIAEWELRIGKFRVFFNADEEMFVVSIEAVGFKIGNLLFIRGKRREL